MCFSPQRRAIFRHLNFKKCPETHAWESLNDFSQMENWTKFCWTTHSNTWEFNSHQPLCHSNVWGTIARILWLEGPARKVLAVLAVRRCLSRCNGVWVCCFPCFAAQAPWRHRFGAKWTFFATIFIEGKWEQAKDERQVRCFERIGPVYHCDFRVRLLFPW